MSNGESPRLDRIEKIVDEMTCIQRDIKLERQLLRASVTPADEIRKQMELSFQRMAAAEQRRDAALKALMRTVEEFLRKK